MMQLNETSFGYRLTELLEQGAGVSLFRGQALGKPDVFIWQVEPRWMTEEEQHELALVLEKMGSLKHPALLPLLDYAITQTDFIQEAPDALVITATPPAYQLLLPSGANGRLLREAAPLQPQEALKLAKWLSEGLQFAHQQGLLHLNLTPQTVHLPSSKDWEQAKISPCGVTFVLRKAGLAPQNMIWQALPYLSPEQLRGEPPTQQSDIYMLGCLLTQLVTGALPFAASNMRAMLRAKQAPPQQISEHLPLNELLHKMLAFAPENRPQSVGDLLERLHTLLLPAKAVGETESGSDDSDAKPAQLSTRRWHDQPNLARRLEVSQPWTHGQFRLLVAHPRETTRFYAFEDDKKFIKIGRSSKESDICLPDPTVDPKHLQLERVGNGWQLLDSGSRNGSYLGRQRLVPGKPEYWRGRTPLQIGPYFLLWEYVEHFGLSEQKAEEQYREDHEVWRQQVEEAHYWLVPEPLHQLEMKMTPPERLEVAPGETGSLAISVRNQQTIVEQVQLKIVELGVAWYTLPNHDQRLRSGEEATLLLQLHPPTMGEAQHGDHRFIVVLYSTDSNRKLGERPYTLHVPAVQAEQIDLRPTHLRQPETVKVRIHNQGNVPGRYLVQARDPGDLLLFEPSEALLEVQPGKQQQTGIKVQPKAKRPFFPPERILPFEILVGAKAATLQPHAGQLRLRPRVPMWALFVVPLLILALVLLVPRINNGIEDRRALEEQAEALRAEGEAEQRAANITISTNNQLLQGQEPEAILQAAAEMEAALAVDPTAPLTVDPGLVTAAEAMLEAEADLANAEGKIAAAEELEAAAADAPLLGGGVTPNVAPSAIALDKTSIPEDTPPGTAVAVIGSTDPNPGDSHIYTLTEGDGDDNNGMFAIVGSQLTLLTLLDFEAREELSVRLQSQDSRGGTHEQRFVLRVDNVNEPPTAILLSNDRVDENVPSAAIGTIIVTDPDEQDTHILTLLEDETGKFEIAGTALRLKAGEALNFSESSTVELEIQAEDSSQTYTQTVTISVADINDAPEVNSIGFSLLEDAEFALPKTLFLTAFKDGDTIDRNEPSELEPVKIKFTALPSAGQLFLGDAPVFVEQEILNVDLGNLRYVPPPNFAQTVLFRWNAADLEGFAVQDAAGTISIIEQNDPPTFDQESDSYTVPEDSGAHNFNWATRIRDEETEPAELNFEICANSKESLFSERPVVNASSGDLTFATAPNQYGTAVLKILLTDGTLNCAAEQGKASRNEENRLATLTIIIEPVNDAPELICPSLEPISATEGQGSDDLPTRVKDILDECVVDVDGKALRWMAVVGVDGDWQFSQSTVTEKDMVPANSWVDFPTDVTMTTAVLLRGSVWLRLDPDFYTAPNQSAKLTFRAWDDSIGESGDTEVNILETGGESAFSSNSATLIVSVMSTPDPTSLLGFESQTECGGLDDLFLAPLARVTDADDLGNGLFNFNTGSLTVSIIDPEMIADEQFSIKPGPTAFGQITVVGPAIEFNDVPFATIQNGADVTFNGNATVEAVSALLRRIHYRGERCYLLSLPDSFEVRFLFKDNSLAQEVEKIVTVFQPFEF